MQPVLFDSSIYITALRMGDQAALALRRLAADSPVWLSSVVLEELYAGAGVTDVHVVERLERDFDRAKRIVVPNLSDWTRPGKVLSQLAAKYDYETSCAGGAPLRMKMGSAGRIWRRGQSLWYKHSWWAIA